MRLTFVGLVFLVVASLGMLFVGPVSVVKTRSAPTTAIANTETQIVGVTVPAGSVLAVGNTYRVTAVGLLTNTTTSTSAVFRVRYGTTTLVGNVAAAVTVATGTTARASIPFQLTALVTVTGVGVSGAAFGGVFVNLYNGVAPVASSPVSAAVVVDTTADNILELTFVSGGSTTTAIFISAVIEALG